LNLLSFLPFNVLLVKIFPTTSGFICLPFFSRVAPDYLGFPGRGAVAIIGKIHWQTDDLSAFLSDGIRALNQRKKDQFLLVYIAL